MKQIDELVQTAAESPDDHTARRVLSDALRANDDHELATAVESKKTGRGLIDRVNELSTSTGLPVTRDLLWAVYVLVPRLSVPAPVVTPVPLPVPEVPAPAPTPWRRSPYLIPWSGDDEFGRRVRWHTPDTRSECGPD